MNRNSSSQGSAVEPPTRFVGACSRHATGRPCAHTSGRVVIMRHRRASSPPLSRGVPSQKSCPTFARPTGPSLGGHSALHPTARQTSFGLVTLIVSMQRAEGSHRLARRTRWAEPPLKNALHSSRSRCWARGSPSRVSVRPGPTIARTGHAALRAPEHRRSVTSCHRDARTAHAIDAGSDPTRPPPVRVRGLVFPPRIDRRRQRPIPLSLFAQPSHDAGLGGRGPCAKGSRPRSMSRIPGTLPV